MNFDFGQFYTIRIVFFSIFRKKSKQVGKNSTGNLDKLDSIPSIWFGNWKIYVKRNLLLLWL